MQNQINLTPIQQFIQQVRSAELTGAKQITMDMQKARLLNLALAECIDKMNRDWETLYHALKQSANPAVVSVEMDGGGFQDSK